MTKSYLEVTYHKGRPLAAYVYLPRVPSDKVARTERRGSMLIDLAADGRALGIELTAPTDVRLAEINALLTSMRQPALEAMDLTPLAAAKDIGADALRWASYSERTHGVRQSMSSNETVNRQIPEAIKREVRQRCGFGCVVCGLPIYEYHHIDDWATVRKHDPNRITLLCDNHHRRATSGLLTFEQICAADAKPRNVTAGITAPEALAFEGTGCEIGLGGGILFRASGSEFSAAPLVIQGRPLIQVSASDEHLFIDLLLMEDATNALLHINKNEMVIGTGHWDVEFVGQTLTLRNAPRQITFDIEFTPPSTVTVTRGFFFWNGSAIRVTPEGVRLINSGNQLRDIRFDASFFVGVAVDGTIPGRGTMLDIGGPGIPFQNLTEAIALEPTVSRIYEEVAREAEGKMKAGEFMRIDRVAMERIEHAVNDFRKDKA